MAYLESILPYLDEKDSKAKATRFLLGLDPELKKILITQGQHANDYEKLKQIAKRIEMTNRSLTKKARGNDTAGQSTLSRPRYASSPSRHGGRPKPRGHNRNWPNPNKEPLGEKPGIDGDTQRKRPRMQEGSRSDWKADVECYHCHKKGHYKTECRKFLAEQSKNGKT